MGQQVPVRQDAAQRKGGNPLCGLLPIHAEGGLNRNRQHRLLRERLPLPAPRQRQGLRGEQRRLYRRDLPAGRHIHHRGNHPQPQHRRQLQADGGHLHALDASAASASRQRTPYCNCKRIPSPAVSCRGKGCARAMRNRAPNPLSCQPMPE